MRDKESGTWYAPLASACANKHEPTVGCAHTPNEESQRRNKTSRYASSHAHVHRTRCLIIWGHARPDTFLPCWNAPPAVQEEEITRGGVESSHQQEHLHTQPSFNVSKSILQKNVQWQGRLPHCTRLVGLTTRIHHSVNAHFDAWHVSCLALLSATCSLVRWNQQRESQKGAGGNYIHVLKTDGCERKGWHFLLKAHLVVSGG